MASIGIISGDELIMTPGLVVIINWDSVNVEIIKILATSIDNTHIPHTCTHVHTEHTSRQKQYDQFLVSE